MPSLPLVVQIILVGIGATALMDLWLWLLSRLGVPSTGFAMVGRWVGHVARGRFVHASVAKAAPVRFEIGLGWLTHYAIGIAYAALLVAVLGEGWLARPVLLPAVAFGVLTVVAPWFVMQPAMGAGFMASKTPTPLRNGLRSLANHTVFGAGLFFSAALLERICP